MMKTTPLITASEIGEYVYCKRGWWLRRKGLLEDNSQMLQGITEHNKLFTKVRFQRPLIRVALFLLIIGIIGLLLTWIVQNFF